MTKTVNTPAGVPLPLLQLKGKDYLQVAHRLIWFNEVERRFSIETKILEMSNDHAITQVLVKIMDEQGNVLRQADGIKREDRKDFADFLEKSQSSSLGRALAMLGYGTQFALADLDEGDRIVDSPVVDVRPSKPAAPVAAPSSPSAPAKAAAPAPESKPSTPPSAKSTPAPTAKATPAAAKPAAPAPAAASNGAGEKKVSSFRKPAKAVDGPTDGWN